MRIEHDVNHNNAARAGSRAYRLRCQSLDGPEPLLAGRYRRTPGVIPALFPTQEERMAQLARLEKWCSNAPRWKRELISAVLGTVIGVVMAWTGSRMPPRGRSDVLL